MKWALLAVKMAKQTAVMLSLAVTGVMLQETSVVTLRGSIIWKSAVK